MVRKIKPKKSKKEKKQEKMRRADDAFKTKVQNFNMIKKNTDEYLVDSEIKMLTIFIGTIAYTLKHNYGWGRKRIADFIEHYHVNMHDLMLEWLSLEDIQDTLKKEANYDLEADVTKYCKL